MDHWKHENHIRSIREHKTEVNTPKQKHAWTCDHLDWAPPSKSFCYYTRDRLDSRSSHQSIEIPPDPVQGARFGQMPSIVNVPTLTRHQGTSYTDLLLVQDQAVVHEDILTLVHPSTCVSAPCPKTFCISPSFLIQHVQHLNAIVRGLTELVLASNCEFHFAQYTKQ